MRIIRPGDSGDAVRDVQHRLLALGHRLETDELSGRFGGTTEKGVRAFQISRGLPEDGIVGPDTWARLVEAGYRLGDRTLYLRSPSLRGDDVLDLQRRLNELGFEAGKEDGIFGRRTHTATLEFQRNIGAPSDGIVGLGTVKALEGVRPAVRGTSRSLVREAESLREGLAGMVGAAIAIDGSVEGAVGNPDAVAPSGTLLDALAVAITNLGAEPVSVTDAGDDPAERARAANSADAAVYLAISVRPSSGSIAHWGTPTTHSPKGLHLCGLISDELMEADVPLEPARPLSVSVLRETRMPAVILELPEETHVPHVARAIARAIERFLEPETQSAD